MNKELIDHVLDKSTTPEECVERAYALGLHEGITARSAVEDRRDENNTKLAFRTIERKNKDLQHITQLVYDNSMQEAKFFALDAGWCINCYTYDCHGDCG